MLSPRRAPVRLPQSWLACLPLVAWVACALLVAGRGAGAYKYKAKQARCEPISIPLCADVRYNLTRMPNLLGHATQREAAAQIHEFIPLVQIGCSRLLKFFLCSQYAPMCTEQVDETLIIPPCRALCLEVKGACEPVLLRFNFHWPPALDCDLLPAQSDLHNLCIDPPNLGDDTGDDGGAGPLPGPSSGSLGAPGNNLAQWARILNTLQAQSEGGTSRPAGGGAEGTELGRVGGGEAERRGDRCPPRGFVLVEKLKRGTDQCAPRCGADVQFSTADKLFMSRWMYVWSSLSLSSSLLTLASLLLDRERFRYPERPIVYVCLCGVGYSSAYVLRALLGHAAVACTLRPDGPDAPAATPVPHLVQEGLADNALCTLTFLVLHYCSMAGAAWWAALTLAWYLAAARQWGAEAIARLAPYFHLVAWTAPAVQVGVALGLRRIEGDELTGLCYVGVRDAGALGALVIAPLAVYTAVGVGFSTAGLLASWRIQHQLKLTGSHTGKLQRLMAKTLVFSALYALPSLSVLACLAYEHAHLPTWHASALAHDCAPAPPASPRPVNGPVCRGLPGESTPRLEVFLLKVFMQLVTGVTVGTWVWSCKTLRAWRAAFGRMRGALCCAGDGGYRRAGYGAYGGRSEGVSTVAGGVVEGRGLMGNSDRFVQRYMIGGQGHR